jgi:hypothetical protein
MARSNALSLVLACLLSASVLVSPSNAQSTNIAVGPYRLGMPMSELMTLLMTAPAEELGLARETRLLRGPPPVTLGGQSFGVNISFARDTLDLISLVRTEVMADPEQCFVAMGGLIAALEPQTGPLDGGAAANGEAVAIRQTPGGSNVHRYADGDALTGISRSGSGLRAVVRARAEPEKDVWSCALRASIGGVDAPRADLLASAPTATELAAAELIEHPQWRVLPDGRRALEVYPTLALDENVSGIVELDCLVGAEGALRCALSSERPLDYGFGQAALVFAADMRMVSEIDGRPTEGRRVHFRVPFRVD